MVTTSAIDALAPREEIALPSLDSGVRFTALEIADLLARLEPELSIPQRDLLHQLRQASERLGALRTLASLE